MRSTTGTRSVAVTFSETIVSLLEHAARHATESDTSTCRNDMARTIGCENKNHNYLSCDRGAESRFMELRCREPRVKKRALRSRAGEIFRPRGHLQKTRCHFLPLATAKLI
jgi:hypothetical protein